MEYITAVEASERWGVSLRQVQRLLAAQRIPGAKKHGRLWMIPDDAQKPADLRLDKKLSGRTLASELVRLIKATSVPMPAGNPDAIIQIIKDEQARLHSEGDLAYLRGDFTRTLRCYHEAEGNEAAKLLMSFLGVAAAISLGDYPAYLKIEAHLKSFVGSGRNSYTSAVAELALASVAVSVYAPSMAPGWLPAGDLSAFPPQANLAYIHYLRAKYFLCIGKYEVALAVAQTALAFSVLERGITAAEINLRVVCALACYNLGRENEARRWLLEAMGIALPHGFITPFAENVPNFGGLMEQCLEEKFPSCFDAILEQCERTVKNWIIFHNHFTRDNITSILTLRELYLAQMVARRVPYTKIARQFNMSVGRLKNVMLEIYEKLCISSRDELAQYVLMTNKGAGS